MRVERGCAVGTEFPRSMRERQGIARRNNEAGSLSASAPGCFQSDPRATTDDNNGLAEQSRTHEPVLADDSYASAAIALTTSSAVTIAAA